MSHCLAPPRPTLVAYELAVNVCPHQRHAASVSKSPGRCISTPPALPALAVGDAWFVESAPCHDAECFSWLCCNRYMSCVITEEERHARLIHIQQYQSLSWSQLRSHVVHPLLQSHYLGTASCFLKNMGPFLGPQFDCSFGNFSCLFILIREVGGVIFRDQKWAHQLVPKTRLRRPFSCTPSRVGPRGRSVRAHGACLGGSPTRAATSIPTTSRRLGRLQPAARRRQHLQDLN